jgi:Uncharacterized conserved protein
MTSLLVACQGEKKAETSIDKAAYQLEIDNWHKKRIEDLKGENGWLNLAGLFWLNEGINTFGSDENSTLVFPEGKIEKRAGFFLLKQGVVTLEVAPKVSISIDGKPVTRRIVFHPDSAKRTVMESGSLRWFVIKREDKIGIRLRDLQAKELTEFNGIERYPVNSEWRVVATFEKSDSLKTIPITNVLGQTFNQPSPGTLVFKINSKEYRLDAIDEGGDELFIIYGDHTNGETTYGAGRYLYVKKPMESSTIVLDFNKGYNPPCAFTAFATCPLPPRQNVLPLSIESGEKNYGAH